MFTDQGEEAMNPTAMGLNRRGLKGIWQHSRRVPVRYAHREQRQLIRTSLHPQDYTLARLEGWVQPNPFQGLGFVEERRTRAVPLN